MTTIASGSSAVYKRIPGAALRAVLVLWLVLIPALIAPADRVENMLVVAFVAVFAAVFTLVEYSSNAPSLVEFRAAPPFNRLRFVSLMLIVFCLSHLARGLDGAAGFTLFAHAIGIKMGQIADFPYSPVRLLISIMPESTETAQLIQMRTMAGLSYLTSIVTLLAFILVLRFRGWPQRSGVFNVWVNLPTFDPAAGGDVVDRLNRDSMFNLILGFLLPFILAAIGKIANDFVQPITITSSHTLIWMITLWAFLPLCLLMRGVALARVAQMIYVQRKRAFARASRSGSQQLV